MKKLSAFLCLFSALQANAIVGGRGNQAMHTLSTMGPFSVSGTTTSLPCLVIEGIEIDLNTPEAQERLEAEMRGDIEPILLNELKRIQDETNL